MFKKYSATSVHMNTQVKFISWSELEEIEVLEYFKLGFAEFERIENLYSRFKESSYLSCFNVQKFSEVTQEFFEITLFLLLFAYKTEGIFDPTIIDILETYGYDKNYNFSKLDNKVELKRNLENLLESRFSYRDIILEIKNENFCTRGNVAHFVEFIQTSDNIQECFSQDFYKLYNFTLGNNSKASVLNSRNGSSIENMKYTIYLKQNQRLEFGGCGKGFAIDKAFERLLPLGNFIIDAGGDIRCSGNIEDRKWSASLYGTNDVVELESGDSFCCSGSSARRVKDFHHLINPKTGTPQNDFKQSFVYCNFEKLHNMRLLTTYADALSTYSFIKGQDIEKELPVGVFVKFLK